MMRLQIVTDKDRKEELRRERRRRIEEDRKKRIFDARTRVIGVDKEFLELQIRDRRQREEEEKKRNEAFAAQVKKNSEIAIFLESQEREKQRQICAEINDYRLRYQKRQDTREYDLNDPAALRKQLPPRHEYDEAPISSAQKFEGEDLASDVRARMMADQRISWLQQQIRERRAGEEDQRKAEDAYMAAMKARDERALMLGKMEQDCRFKIGQAVQRFNTMLAAERKEKEMQSKIEESQDNCAEMFNILTSDLMTENPDAAQSALGPSRKIAYMYKGMSATEREKLHKDVLEQIDEQKKMRADEARRNAEFESMAKDIGRRVAIMDLQDHRQRSEVAKIISTENQLMATQQMEKNKHYNEMFTSNQPNDDYFDQFNTTAR